MEASRDDRATASGALEALLQLDVAQRASRHRELLGLLRDVAESEGPSRARACAQRAVSPLLDYSSLVSLRQFLPLSTAEDTEAPLRVAILGGATTAQLRGALEVFLAGHGVVAEIYEGPFGLFRQEVLAPESPLDAFRPQVLFLATSARDVARLPSLDLDEPDVVALAERELADWRLLWETAALRWNATVIQNTFEIAPGGVLGHHALRQHAARETYLERLNGMFGQKAPAHVVLHDLRALAAEEGARAWFDARYYHEFKMPCGPQCLVPYAHSVVALLLAVLGRSRKVLVLDLDDTLWGGPVGDLGAGSIRLGEGSAEGEAFLAIQRHAKALRERGVLLAVCSKNDPSRAREPFEKRSDMVLELGDFAAFVASWDRKADNLRAIAEQLNLRLDSLVFLDDSPVERAQIRRFLPEVAVPDMPEDPSAFVQSLSLHRYFETVGLTHEDALRSRYYAENAQRREVASSATDLDSFLRSLAMRMKVAPVSELNVERATQLINKSNQYNLTTRRYTLAEVSELRTARTARTLTFSLRDTLGDSGLISVVLLRVEADDLVIDAWVMSCRVLQRGVERFVRDELVLMARREGRARLRGTYVPGAKNGMVERHYESLGFESAHGADGTSWLLALDHALPLHHHIAREPDG